MSETIPVLCVGCNQEFDLPKEDFAKLDPTEYLCPSCTAKIEHEGLVIARFQQRYEPMDFQD